jgi:tyrosinase
VIERKNAFKLSADEQKAYKDGVEGMIKDGTFKKLVDIHSDMTHNMHTMGSIDKGTWRFLSWHRAYLLHMEAELRKKEPKAFVPYWKWDDGGVPDWLKDFKPKVGAIENKRNFLTKAIIDKDGIAKLKAIPDYNDFTYALEAGPHNHGHGLLGAPMDIVQTAPADPIFWMHHGQVDKIWAEWQDAHPGKGPVLTGSDAVMDPWTETVDDLASIAKLGYKYV